MKRWKLMLHRPIYSTTLFIWEMDKNDNGLKWCERKERKKKEQE